MENDNKKESEVKISDRDIDIAVLQKRRDQLQRQSLKGNRMIYFFITIILMGLALGSILFFLDPNETGNVDRKTHDSLSTIRIRIHYNDHKEKDVEFKYDSINNQTPKSITELFEKDRLSIKNYYHGKRIEDLRLFLIGGPIILFIIGLFIMTADRIARKSELRQIKIKLLEIGAQELKDNIEIDFFTKLVEINFKYLDQYYLQTQEQADKSFWLSVIAGVVGFIIIITGVIMMFLNADKNFQPSYITTGAGVITEFIASVFFYLYNRTILKMSQYHQKLVITQNISLALKTADALHESKEKVLEKIIESLTQDVNKHLSNSKD
jgi:hypothetical protein